VWQKARGRKSQAGAEDGAEVKAWDPEETVYARNAERKLHMNEVFPVLSRNAQNVVSACRGADKTVIRGKKDG